MANESTLFVEGLKMRPSAEAILIALQQLDGEPTFSYQTGNSIPQLAEHTGLKKQVVRARLQDLRRLGLVVSGTCLVSDGKAWNDTYGHHLTSEGVRRAQQARSR